MQTLKGWRTLAGGGVIAVLPGILNALLAVPWTEYVPADVALIIAGLLMIGLRFVTNSPVGGHAAPTVAPTVEPLPVASFHTERIYAAPVGVAGFHPNSPMPDVVYETRTP